VVLLVDMLLRNTIAGLFIFLAFFYVYICIVIRLLHCCRDYVYFVPMVLIYPLYKKIDPVSKKPLVGG
jgi:hypothetical protein